MRKTIIGLWLLWFAMVYGDDGRQPVNPSSFSTDSPGELVRVPSRTGETGWAFIPNSLASVSFPTTSALLAQAESAALALGQLSGLGRHLPNPMLLFKPFLSREAVASSRIEGTQADFHQLVVLEAGTDSLQSDPDVQEVANYVTALLYGWEQPREREISVSLLRELHQQLMAGVRGATKDPGQLRSAQVFIGSPTDNIQTARFVPSPPFELRGLLDGLCEFINTSSTPSALIRLAMIHYQFEVIHPFLDGNGRLGRLLMPLLLRRWGMLDHPMLYLSEYFERNRDQYIDLLHGVSTQAEWLNWITFTLNAVEVQSRDAFERASQLLHLRETLRAKYQTSRTAKVLNIIDALFERPTINVNQAAAAAKMTYAPAAILIKNLVEQGILVEITGQRRNQIFLAPQIYEAILGEPYRQTS